VGTREEGKTVNVSEMTRDQLRKLAAERNVQGRGRMTKAQLIAALTEQPKQEAPELSKLAALGITETTHNVVKVIRIIREWAAQGVDVLTWDEVLNFILVRNQA